MIDPLVRTVVLAIALTAAVGLVSTPVAAQVVACENSMRGQELTREDLRPDIAYVAAGVVELMQRQREGHACTRP